ncbi:hypothetical protein RHMOL_Rhmol06G0127900 [Rhododendron molle]|uniref:Uncharacterized protein n=1 Tax=Rhododendron molle TaxID=49168 RepID=A0ACC0ND98_RHOML|nr:hypothetical protein RHMOL_Rhmol06G0127900 [Rhododendron molle]
MVPDEAAECAGKAIASAMIFSPPRPSRHPDLPLTLSPIRSPVILERAFSEIETLGGCQWRRFGADLTCYDLRFVRCLQWFEPFSPYLQPKLYSDLHHWDQGFKQSEDRTICVSFSKILKENKDKRDAEFNERFKHRPPKALD